MLPRYCAARHERTSRGWLPVPPPSPPPPRPPPPPTRGSLSLSPRAGFYAAPSRRILLFPPPPTPRLPTPPHPHSCSPCQTHEPIDCRFCIICQDPNSLMHVPPLSPPPFLLSLPSPFTRSPSSDLFLYSPVSYSAVGVFFNNERNVSSTSNSFHGGGTTCRDQTQELMPREMIVDAYDAGSREFNHSARANDIVLLSFRHLHSPARVRKKRYERS